jgi:hypothetical protein
MIACPLTYGEAVTTVPSNRDHVFALGRQDMLFFTKSLNPVIRTPTCVWHRFAKRMIQALDLPALTIMKVNAINAIQTMSPEISIRKDYILVEPKAGINYREIRRALARLFYASGIPDKNGIWVFREGQEKFSDDDLYKLKDIIKENYPKDVMVNKTAIVVGSESQSRTAESFRQNAEDLPLEIRVFSDFQTAEDWIKE